jgi:hypothetical protein
MERALLELGVEAAERSIEAEAAVDQEAGR